MNWKKLGRIFNPVDHHLPEGCNEYAQSPQAIVFKDFVRIYFSTRRREPNGKFLSNVAFVDTNRSLTSIQRVASNSVIKLGEIGSYYEHGVFPLSPLRDGDVIRAYVCGWSRRVSVSVETSVGLAISNDEGETFSHIGTGPIMSSSLREPFLVGDAFVRVFDNTYHMWYIYGTRWINGEGKNAPERVYKIAHASSNDGISWKRDGKTIIEDKLGRDECQALPSVIKWKGIYHMVFCYRFATDFRSNRERGYKLGYAYSTDLKTWTRSDNQVGMMYAEGQWDSDMQCYPTFFECDDRLYLLYNGNEFGRYGFGAAVLEERSYTSD
jgi:hypothetical protein